MKNNIYIGNRYVPRFADPVEWDNLREYEPLTIVTYEGTSYTSKKTVPVGTPLSDRNYWVVTGNYNQQVEAYRQEVEEIAERVDNIEQDGWVAGNRIASGAVTTQKIANNAITTQKINDASITHSKIANKAIGITNLDNRKIVVIGDSLTSGVGAAHGWAYYLNQKVGYTTYDFSVGGQGFVNNSGGTFLTQATNAVNSTDFGNDDISDIIVIGGYNDYSYSPSQVSSAVSSLITYLHNNFNNARVYVGAMLKGIYPLNYAIGGASESQYRSRLINSIEYSAKKNGALIIDKPWTWLLGDTEFNIDNIHVNTLGQQYLANCILNVLNGCPNNIFKQSIITSGVDSHITECFVDITLCNGIVNIYGHVKIDEPMFNGNYIICELPIFAYTSFFNNIIHVIGSSGNGIQNTPLISTQGTQLILNTLTDVGGTQTDAWFNGNYMAGL